MLWLKKTILLLVIERFFLVYDYFSRSLWITLYTRSLIVTNPCLSFYLIIKMISNHLYILSRIIIIFWINGMDAETCKTQILYLVRQLNDVVLRRPAPIINIDQSHYFRVRYPMPCQPPQISIIKCWACQASSKWNGACKNFPIFYVTAGKNTPQPCLMPLLVVDFVVSMLFCTYSIHIYVFTSI